MASAFQDLGTDLLMSVWFCVASMSICVVVLVVAHMMKMFNILQPPDT